MKVERSIIINNRNIAIGSDNTSGGIATRLTNPGSRDLVVGTLGSEFFEAAMIRNQTSHNVYTLKKMRYFSYPLEMSIEQLPLSPTLINSYYGMWTYRNIATHPK